VIDCSGPGSIVYSNGTQTYVSWLEPTFSDNSGLPVTVVTDAPMGYYRVGE